LAELPQQKLSKEVSLVDEGETKTPQFESSEATKETAELKMKVE